MLVKDFIKNSLDRIHKAFPNSRLEYQYKDISNTHFIKITPINIFSEETFIDLDFELTDEFRELDLNGSLCFLTEDSLVKLDNPSKIIYPKNNIIDSLGFLEKDLSAKIFFGDSTFQSPKVDFPILEEIAGDYRLAMAA